VVVDEEVVPGQRLERLPAAVASGGATGWAMAHLEILKKIGFSTVAYNDAL
jgi:hypothetical protein